MQHPVMHFEIMGQDSPKLRNSYVDVFGRDVAAPVPASEVEHSLLEIVSGVHRGIRGAMGKAPIGCDGHVSFYLVVDEIENAFAKIEEHGGPRTMGPCTVSDESALEFYKKAFGGNYEIPYRDGDKASDEDDGGNAMTASGDSPCDRKFGALCDRFGTQRLVTAP